MHCSRWCVILISLQLMIDVSTAACRSRVPTSLLATTTSAVSVVTAVSTLSTKGGRQPLLQRLINYGSLQSSNEKDNVDSRFVEKGAFAPLKNRSLHNKQQECIPLLLQPWVFFYRLFPKVNAPLTNLDITFTLVSALFLTCLDYGSAFVFQAATKWPRKETRMVAGSITTIFHSTILVPGLCVCLLSERYAPSCRMDVHPVWWQDAASALIQFCTGYMV
jgi:hypothetical protein